MATRKWPVYLKEAPSIVLLTVHYQLRWLQGQKDPKRTYARWLMELQELPFRTGYRTGWENVVADYLTRTPAMKIDEEADRELSGESPTKPVRRYPQRMREASRYLPDYVIGGQLTPRTLGTLVVRS